jgi:hypothetical protein
MRTRTQELLQNEILEERTLVLGRWSLQGLGSSSQEANDSTTGSSSRMTRDEVSVYTES